MLLGLPDDIHKEKPSFLQFKKNALQTDQPTNRRTDRQTDRPSYRNARRHLKTISKLRANFFRKKGGQLTVGGKQPAERELLSNIPS